MQKFWPHLKKLSFLLPLIAITIFFYFVSPETLVSYVGVENAYIFMFLIAFLGGVTMFSAVPYPAILVAFGLGGLNPFLLGLAATLGLFLGDSTSFFVGKKSGELITGKAKKALDKILELYDKFPKLMPFFFFIYGAVVPLPNDVVTVSAGLKEYPYKKTMMPLALGNLVFCVSLAYAADFFSGIF